MKHKGAEPTITDVARLADVSIATVSRVLNDPSKVRAATVVRVNEAIEELGYRHERPAPPQRNGLIVAVLPNLDNPFYSKIIKGMQVAAKNRGLEVLIYPEPSVDAHMLRLADLLRLTNAGGQIILSPVSNESVLAELNAVAPLVQCAEYNERSPLPYVSVDDFAAAKNAVETLLRAGRRRIGIINGQSKYKYSRQRYLGYEDALRCAGIQTDASLIARVTEMGFDSSFAVARQMLQSAEPPDAILATSDMYAAAVVKAADMQGISIPSELALISFDNTYISQLSQPSITAVNMPQFQLGYMACEVLADWMQNPSSDETRQFLLNTELVMRNTV